MIALFGAVVALLPLLPAVHLHDATSDRSPVVHRHLLNAPQTDSEAETSQALNQHTLTARALDDVLWIPAVSQWLARAMPTERLVLPAPPSARISPPSAPLGLFHSDKFATLPSRAPPSGSFPII